MRKRLEPFSKRWKIAAHISRVIMGLVFILSGFLKVIDPWGTSIKVDEYMLLYGLENLLPMSMGFAIWLCGSELLMGCMLTFKVRIRFVSIGALISMTIFTVVTLLSATVLPVEDCGCFGQAIKLTPWQTFFKNLFLLPLAFILWYRYRPDKIFLFKKIEILLATCFFFFSMGLGVYCYRHLPLIDYLPYKVGLNLPQAIERAKSLPVEDVETLLLYRNKQSGKIREFALTDREWYDDSKWEWVETKTITNGSNIRPLLSEFVLTDLDGNIVTYEILATKGGLNILFVTTLEGVSDRCYERMERFVNGANERGERTIYVTPERLNPMNPFLDLEGYNIDPTTMKTVLRASAGLVQLKDGVIIGKYNWRDI